MNIRFYTTIQQKPKFLKFENRAEIYVGLQFDHKETTYQVTALKWVNRKKGIIKAFCCELPIYHKVAAHF